MSAIHDADADMFTVNFLIKDNPIDIEASEGNIGRPGGLAESVQALDSSIGKLFWSVKRDGGGSAGIVIALWNGAGTSRHFGQTFHPVLTRFVPAQPY